MVQAHRQRAQMGREKKLRGGGVYGNRERKEKSDIQLYIPLKDEVRSQTRVVGAETAWLGVAGKEKGKKHGKPVTPRGVALSTARGKANPANRGRR